MADALNPPTTAVPSSAPSSNDARLSNSNLPAPLKTHKPIAISSHAPIEEFRKFREAMKHPSARLGIDIFGEERVIDGNEVTSLCEEVLTSISDFQTAMEELSIWKNEFVKQNIPSSVKLSLVLLFSRLFRSNSNLHEPLFELVRTAKMYSLTWMTKQDALMSLEDDFKRQKKALEIAIRKMENMKSQAERSKREKIFKNWERIVSDLLEKWHADHPEDEIPDGMALLAAFHNKMTSSRRNSTIGDPDGPTMAPTAEAIAANLNAIVQDGETNLETPRSKSAKTGPSTDLLKVRKALTFAFGRVFRRRFPNFKEELLQSQYAAPLIPVYVSEAQDAFDYSAKQRRTEVLRRSNSETRMHSVYLRKRQRALHVRLNSCGLYEELRMDNAIVKRDVREPLETGQQVLNTFIEEPPVEVEEIFEEVDGASVAEEQLLDDNDSKIREAVNGFLQNEMQQGAPSAKVRFDDLWSTSSEQILKNTDIDNTWFSLRDVMELILLHTHQSFAIQMNHELQMREVGVVVNKVEVARHETRAYIPDINPMIDMYESPLSAGIDEAYFAFNDDHKIVEDTITESKSALPSHSDINTDSDELTALVAASGKQASRVGTGINVDAISKNVFTASSSDRRVSLSDRRMSSSDRRVSSASVHSKILSESATPGTGTFSREPKPTFQAEQAMLSFFTRMNDFLNKKLDNHKNLKQQVRENERKRTEGTLRTLNVFSRRSSNESEKTKHVFDFEGLDQVRQKQVANVPKLDSPTASRTPKGAFVNVSTVDPEMMDQQEDNAAQLKTVNLFKDRKKSGKK